MNRNALRIAFGGLFFALWALGAAFVVYYDLEHHSFGIWTIIVVLVSGFFAFMRLLRAWLNEPRSE